MRALDPIGGWGAGPRGGPMPLASAIFTFAAETRAGLVTRESFLIEVESKSDRSRPMRWRRGRGRH
jgi:hypothetical protein